MDDWTIINAALRPGEEEAAEKGAYVPVKDAPRLRATEEEDAVMPVFGTEVSESEAGYPAIYATVWRARGLTDEQIGVRYAEEQSQQAVRFAEHQQREAARGDS